MSKVVASHQPHFFPWLGYFDKMAKADLFLVNDVVQLELKSPMVRNRILNKFGVEQYITVTVDKEGYEEKPNRFVRLKDFEKTGAQILGILRDAYHKCPGFPEIWGDVEDILKGKYDTLFELEMRTVDLGRRCLGVETPLLRHSEMTYETGDTTSERLAMKLASVGADVYLSGAGGAKKYMNDDDFSSRGIRVAYQQFTCPVYVQDCATNFVPNLSFLDIVFRMGTQNARELFWENVKSTNETETNET